METFKVGDEVENIRHDLYDPFQTGARGTIESKSCAGWWVKYTSGEYRSNRNDGSGVWSTLENQLRHVPPSPQPAPAVKSPAVKSRAVVLDVDGVEYTAMFTFVNDRTGCLLYWRKKNREYGTAGGAKRNPNDAYNADTAMRVAMRRACGVGEPGAHDLSNVYRAFRNWQHDQAELREAAKWLIEQLKALSPTVQLSIEGALEIIGMTYAWKAAGGRGGGAGCEG